MERGVVRLCRPHQHCLWSSTSTLADQSSYSSRSGTGPRVTLLSAPAPKSLSPSQGRKKNGMHTLGFWDPCHLPSHHNTPCAAFLASNLFSTIMPSPPSSSSRLLTDIQQTYFSGGAFVKCKSPAVIGISAKCLSANNALGSAGSRESLHLATQRMGGGAVLCETPVLFPLVVSVRFEDAISLSVQCCWSPEARTARPVVGALPSNTRGDKLHLRPMSRADCRFELANRI